ncbi:MAG: ABC transporter ATP-binding protein, partial [Alphaproteobacteria bacterium]
MPIATSELEKTAIAAAQIAPRLTLAHVSHRYGRMLAVDDVSFSVAAGEFVCLLGPSGCGKSTLLRIITGLVRQTSGQILIDGQEVAGTDVFVAPEKRGVGLMFQDYALFPHLDVLHNVAFGLSALGRAARHDAAMAALQAVDMAKYAQSYPHALSGGEQQRVALARAMAPRPKIMLMDEPFSGLDRRLRDDVRAQTVAILAQ